MHVPVFRFENKMASSSLVCVIVCLAVCFFLLLILVMLLLGDVGVVVGVAHPVLSCVRCPSVQAECLKGETLSEAFELRLPHRKIREVDACLQQVRACLCCACTCGVRGSSLAGVYVSMLSPHFNGLCVLLGTSVCQAP